MHISCLHLGGQLCVVLCYQKLSHKAMVQLEILIDRDDYFTSNIDLGIGPNQAIWLMTCDLRNYLSWVGWQV
jgi:hypothetical protein